MATKQEADGNHPSSHYLVVEDPDKPSTWHLRVRDASGAVDHRLMGAAWAALHGGYRGNVYAGPQKERALGKLIAMYEHEGIPTPSAHMSVDAEFAGPPQADADMVIRSGKLFQCGDYPDKAFSFDEEDLAHAIATFQPVPLDLEHVPTVLDGKLGRVTRVYAGEDGRTLLGDVQMPGWLDQLLQDGERKVSATWNRATKQLEKLALVRNPRVSDAALMAAFSAASDDGQSAGTDPAHSQRSTKLMNIREWLTGKAKEEGVELDPADLEAAFSAGDVNAKLSQKDQEIAALKAEQERHAAEFARVATEKRQAEAVTFAQSQVAAHRVAPASAEPLAALVSHVASIDASATFAEGETSGTVLLQAFLASLPDLSVLTTEHIKGEGAAALFNQDTTPGLDGKEGEITPERIKALMAASPLGRAVLDSTTA